MEQEESDFQDSILQVLWAIHDQLRDSKDDMNLKLLNINSTLDEFAKEYFRRNPS